MTAPETIFAINGSIARVSEVAIDHDDVEYTRTDLTIRRDDPVLKQVMYALRFLDAQLDSHGFADSGPMRSACNGTIAALKERIGGDNGQTD